MKKLSFLHSAMAALMLAAAFTSCSKNDDDSPSIPDEPTTPYHYDLTVSIGNHGGMGQDKQGHLTMSLTALNDASKTVNFQGQGSEITDYTMEAICKGKYMYQVPVSADRFSKLQFKNNKIEVVQEQKFKDNTYSPRNYTHAWLDKNTLLIMSTTDDHTKVIWTKLNTKDMSIIAEGSLDDIKVAEGYNVLTTSGIVGFIGRHQGGRRI